MDLKLPQKKTVVAPALIWKRVAAFLIDLLILNYLIIFPLVDLLAARMPKSASFAESLAELQSAEFQGTIFLIGLFAGIVSMLYFMILEHKFGQTAGKMIMNIRVISNDGGLKYWQLAARSAFLLPIFPFVLLWLIDPLFMLFTKEKNRLSEIISRTKVVETFEY